MNRKNELCQILLDIKASTGLSDDKFSEFIQIDLARWKLITTNEKLIKISDLQKICRHLNITIDYLFIGVVDLLSISRRFHNYSYKVGMIKTLYSRKLCSLNQTKNIYQHPILPSTANILPLNG